MTTETHTFANPNTQKWALAIGSTASFMIGLDALVISTALPILRIIPARAGETSS